MTAAAATGDSTGPSRGLRICPCHTRNRGHICPLPRVAWRWPAHRRGRRGTRPAHHDLAQLVVPGADVLHQHLEGGELELGGQRVELLLLHLLELHSVAKLPHELDPESGLGPEKVRMALSPGQGSRRPPGTGPRGPGSGRRVLPSPCASGCQAPPGAAPPVARPREASAASVGPREGGEWQLRGWVPAGPSLWPVFTTRATIPPAKLGPRLGVQKGIWEN